MNESDRRNQTSIVGAILTNCRGSVAHFVLNLRMAIDDDVIDELLSRPEFLHRLRGELFGVERVTAALENCLALAIDDPQVSNAPTDTRLQFEFQFRGCIRVHKQIHVTPIPAAERGGVRTEFSGAISLFADGVPKKKLRLISKRRFLC